MTAAHAHELAKQELESFDSKLCAMAHKVPLPAPVCKKMCPSCRLWAKT
jgi:hypothetical protein